MLVYEAHRVNLESLSPWFGCHIAEAHLWRVSQSNGRDQVLALRVQWNGMRGNDSSNMVMCEELYCNTGYQTEDWYGI